MKKVNLPDGRNGPWEIKKFLVDRLDFHALSHGRAAPTVGETYTRLTRNNYLVMSDTPAEMGDHWEAVYKAKGSCLLNGLGLGMVLKNIIIKPGVTDITVIEISQELINLVSPHYRDKRINYICANALDYKPPKAKKYNMIWHDIWDNICTDNLLEMEKLHRKYGKKTEWQGSWCKYECQRYK